MQLDRKKLSLIHVAKARLGMSDDDYRGMLRRAAHVESSRDLDEFGFGQVMTEFERLGFRSDFADRNLGNRIDRATPAQVAKIRALWAAFTDDTGTDTGLGKWLGRQFKISSIRFLTPEAAHKAIGGLTMMNMRKAAKRGEGGQQ